MSKIPLRISLTIPTCPFNIENVLKDVLEYLPISLNIKVKDILKHLYISFNTSDVLKDTFTYPQILRIYSRISLNIIKS